jgi:hypothetical protein
MLKKAGQGLFPDASLLLSHYITGQAHRQTQQ